MVTTVCRKEYFNAAHRLNNPKWDAQKNKEFFGACNNDNYHGHNYELHIKVTGEVDAETGYLIDLKELSDLVKKEIINPFDHKNLNLDVEEFKNMNPTAENIAYIIYHKLKTNLAAHYKLCIVLFETPRNFVEYNGE